MVWWKSENETSLHKMTWLLQEHTISGSHRRRIIF